MKRIVLLFSVLAAAAHGQTVTVPSPSTYLVQLAWTAASGCTDTAPCTYQVYRVPGTETITAGTAGATLVTTSASQAVTANDPSVIPGQTYSYAVTTVQAGANSVPSNTVTVAIPLVPSAPTGVTGAVSQ